MKKKHFFIIIIITIAFSCSSQQYNKKNHSQNLQALFLNKEFKKASDLLKKQIRSAPQKDRLLYLLEIGALFHSINSWEKSNLALLEAEEILDNTYKSISQDIKGYFLNESQKNYRPEVFERILVKLYIALNFLFLEKREKALRYFQKISLDQRIIRDSDSSYQQNTLARYLYAILAESLGYYNQARVQYNNLLASKYREDEIKANLLHLAQKEKDFENIEKFSNYTNTLAFYSTNLNVTNSLEGYGELVIIYEYGVAPYKKSRGRIGNDPNFMPFLQTSYLLAIARNNSLAIADTSVLLQFIKSSENPIPVYTLKENYNDNPSLTFNLNEGNFSTRLTDDYHKVVIQNYNQNYNRYVTANVSKIFSKIMIASLSSEVINQTTGNAYLGLLSSLFSGAMISASIKADLRSWSLLFKSVQLKRLRLAPGDYNFFIENDLNYRYLNLSSKSIAIEKGKTVFLKVRGF